MQLGELSDAELVSGIKEKCRDEHRFVAEIVAYLAEVEKRDLHRELGSSSLYNFCLHKLGMSEGMALRRMTAARLVGEFSSLLPRIADGRLHLSGLVLLKPYFTKDNVEELADAASRLSETRIKLLIAQRFPAADVPELVRPAPTTPARMPLAASPSPAPPANAPALPCSRTKPLSSTSYLVQLTVSTETHAKLLRARDLMRHRQPDGNLASVIDRALDTLLEQLERQRLGRVKRPRKNAASLADPGDVSRAARRKVFERDGEQCTFRGPDGERCPEKAFLELDHVAMRTFGGDGQPTNLRVMCGAHNRHLASKALGKSYVPKRRRGRRTKVPIATNPAELTRAPAPVIPGAAARERSTAEPVDVPLAAISSKAAAGETKEDARQDDSFPDLAAGTGLVVPSPLPTESHAPDVTNGRAQVPLSVNKGTPPDVRETSSGEDARVKQDLRRRRSQAVDEDPSSDEARAVYGLSNMGFRRPSCVRVVRDILGRGDAGLSLSSLLREAIGTLAAER